MKQLSNDNWRIIGVSFDNDNVFSILDTKDFCTIEYNRLVVMSNRQLQEEYGLNDDVTIHRIVLLNATGKVVLNQVL